MKVSLLILNWKRSENLKLILDKECNYGCIDEVLVFNNNKEVVFSHAHAKVKVLNASFDFGLRTRWILGALAKNDCLVFQDDDIILAEEAFSQFVDALEHEPNRAYSLHGRNLGINQGYTQEPAVGEVAIVLTRATCIHKKQIPLILECERRYMAEHDGLPDRNGEDIFLSYCLASCYGKKHLIMPARHRNLPSPYAISSEANHLLQRSQLIKKLLEFFSGHHGRDIRRLFGGTGNKFTGG